MKHPPASRWIPLTFEALWYRAENSGDRLVLRKVLQTAVSADWRDTRFLDDAEPGAPATWPAGGYRVDVWVDRTKIASESFDIR